MVIEHPVLPFLHWLPRAAGVWVGALAVLIVVSMLVGFGFIILRNGPTGVFSRFWTGLKNGLADMFQMSWRRVWAIARLIMKESIRKKVIVVCAVFLVILMFAGWFLDPESTDPARLYLSFVLSTTSYLVLLLALFLSALSLPADFKNKTIFTIVTKPVRPSEIVLGRILGLTIIGSGILVIMAIASYFFVSFSLSHTHVVIQNEDIFPVASGGNTSPNAVIAAGETRLANGHKHKIEEYADGSFFVQEVNNHTHNIVRSGDADDPKYTVSNEHGTIQAKVPLYGSIRFRDSTEFERSSGINVGEEWNYRTYIEGASSEAIIWTFENLNPKRFSDGVPIEMNISVYRTHKGNIEKTIMGSLLVRNPRTGLTAAIENFNSEKYTTKALFIPRTIDRSKVERTPRLIKIYGEESTYSRPEFSYDPEKETYDLFEDFMADGKIEIWLTCLDSGQYFGAAEHDLYVYARNANVLVNFFKGYFGVWQEMVILISFGVLFSTFLSGPVAMVSTFGILIAAFCKELFMQIALKQTLGGGLAESMVRLVNHENMMSDLPNTVASSLIKFFDTITSGLLLYVGLAIPSFADFDIYTNSLASGFDISWNTIAVHAVRTISYVVPLFVVGYLILRNREVAK